MTGGRSPYRKGYRFETRVRKYLESQGFLVIRQHGSAFPDLLAYPDPNGDLHLYDTLGICFVECKVRKYLSREEKERFKPFSLRANCFVAHPEKNSVDGKNIIVFTEYPTGNRVHTVRG
jgi:Holliday junction resolvase